MVLVISYYASIKHTCSHVGACMSPSRCQHLFSLWLDHNLCNRCKKKRRNELWRVHNFINMKECFKRYEEALVIQEVTFCPRLEKRCSHISIPQKWVTRMAGCLRTISSTVGGHAPCHSWLKSFRLTIMLFY